MKIALVTGASSGLGREFVRQIAEQGKVEEIWAIARRRDRLEALQSISAVPIRVLALDLTRPGDMEYLRNTLQDELPDIRILVNAAGMGRMGPTVDIPAKDNDAMIDLNCRAAVDVTDAAFPYLHPGSQVLEICSTAGFQPIPGLNVYAATKAFLLSYTQTLHYELSPAGIHVTAVCPYWVKDTEFIGIAEKGGHGFRHYPLASRSQDVVRRALRDSALNLRVSTPGLVCTLHRAAAKVTPNLLCLPLADWLRQDEYYARVKAKFTGPVAERFFDTDALCALLDAHRAGKTNAMTKLWAFYCFIEWYEVYFTEKIPPDL